MALEICMTFPQSIASLAYANFLYYIAFKLNYHWSIFLQVYYVHIGLAECEAHVMFYLPRLLVFFPNLTTLWAHDVHFAADFETRYNHAG